MPEEPIDHHTEAIRLSKMAHDNFDHPEEGARERSLFQLQRAQMHATLAVADALNRQTDQASRAESSRRLTSRGFGR